MSRYVTAASATQLRPIGHIKRPPSCAPGRVNGPPPNGSRARCSRSTTSAVISPRRTPPTPAPRHASDTGWARMFAGTLGADLVSRARTDTGSEGTGSAASLPHCAHRSDLNPLDAPCARQGAPTWLRSPRRRVSVAGESSRAAAQHRQGAVASCCGSSRDRLRAPRWRGSPRRTRCDRVAAALAYDHEDRRAL